jgi:NADH-quinone oxidoreductase subunit L
VIGAATAIFAATIGLAQNDIKKVLAYSTVSQLGYMFLACGVGAFIAGIFHVMTHAFFKALLFLGSGSVIHGMNNEQDIRRMGGLRKYMKITFATMFVAWLAISGFPLLSGFFSKDEILWRTWSTTALHPAWLGKALWGVAAFTALLTAVYMTRMMVLTFWGRERFGHEEGHGHAAHDDHGHHGQPHESGWLMTVPLIILAALSIAGGYVGVSPAMSNLVGVHAENKFEHFLEPAIAKAGEPAIAKAGEPAVAERTGQEAAHAVAHDTKTELSFTAISSLVAIIGLLLGWLIFTKNPLKPMPAILENKYKVDELYDATIVTPIEQTSRHFLWQVVDVKIIDGFVNSLARGFAGLANVLRYTQTGFARNYAAVILIGAIIVIGYFGYIALR